MTEQKALSIEKINQLSGYCNKLQEQNKNLQRDLRNKKQEFEELFSGVLMIAELLGIDVFKGEKSADLISVIAATIEELQEKSRKSQDSIPVIKINGTIRENIEKGISGV